MGNGRQGGVKEGRDFALRVAVQQDAGTAEYLREAAPGREGGAYISATPRPRGGSVITMTLPLLPDVDPARLRRWVGSRLLSWRWSRRG
ncbi:MAG: hypothetical protein ACYC1D_08510 [Acidimicrobiales bacterium]